VWVRSTTFVGDRVEHTAMLHVCSCPGPTSELSMLTLGEESILALQCPSCHALVMINAGRSLNTSAGEESQ